MKHEATVTSKGQVTIPVEVRRHLGVDAGDRVWFENGPHGGRVLPVRRTSLFARYRGIGNPGLIVALWIEAPYSHRRMSLNVGSESR